MKITSLQNPWIKETIQLRDRRSRDEKGSFLIEGYRELHRAVQAGWKIDVVFYCPEWFLGSNEHSLLSSAQCRLQECSKEVFAKLSYRDRPDGILAVAPQVHKSLQDFSISANPFLLVAESIEKPGNLGTILRSCDAAGVDGVLVCDRTTDIYNPNVVRSSVGTVFTVPIIETSSQDAIAFLRKNKIAIAAATPHGDREYTQADFQIPLAIAMGTEQYGLSDLWMNQADAQVRIPMLGIADSLNVASATTLLLYEVVRQRRSRSLL